jgi:predicted nuclease with TOPRIM domain
MKKYQELESKIAELQKEVQRLKEEENKLLDEFNRDACIKFLEEFSRYDLSQSFTWNDTPQGAKYWYKIYKNLYDESDYEVPQEAIIYIQGLIIKSYQQEESKMRPLEELAQHPLWGGA